MSDVRTSQGVVSTSQGDQDALRYVSAESDCPYLPEARARTEAYGVDRLDGKVYERLLGRGFRRSGRVVYRPRCLNCNECRSIRIPTDQFVMSRSLRRVWRINTDLRVEVNEPQATPEKFDIFLRYLDKQHDDTMTRTMEAYLEFLYNTPAPSIEFDYFLGERLVGVSLVDHWSSGLSSVYMYFDPDAMTRSLGTYSVLWEVDYAKRHNISYYYLGYFVANSPKMAYKSRFRPNEILVGDNRWITFRE